MIEGIKKIREAFKRITERIKKQKRNSIQKTDQALRLSENLEKVKEVRKKMMVTGEEMSKALKEKSKRINDYMKGKPEEAIIFADGKKDAKARKLFRSIHNGGNNRRKMNGQPLKRFIAKQKVRKRKVSESDTMK